MQKKLADYFRILIEQKDNLLAEYYETKALLRSEEAVLITGLLFSLNIVDCNLCLKVKTIAYRNSCFKILSWLNIIKMQPIIHCVISDILIPGRKS